MRKIKIGSLVLFDWMTFKSRCNEQEGRSSHTVVPYVQFRDRNIFEKDFPEILGIIVSERDKGNCFMVYFPIFGHSERCFSFFLKEVDG